MPAGLNKNIAPVWGELDSKHLGSDSHVIKTDLQDLWTVCEQKRIASIDYMWKITTYQELKPAFEILSSVLQRVLPISNLETNEKWKIYWKALDAIMDTKSLSPNLTQPGTACVKTNFSWEPF